MYNYSRRCTRRATKQQNNNTRKLSKLWLNKPEALSGLTTALSTLNKIKGKTESTCTLKLFLIALLSMYPMYTKEVYPLRAKAVAPRYNTTVKISRRGSHSKSFHFYIKLPSFLLESKGTGGSVGISCLWSKNFRRGLIPILYSGNFSYVPPRTIYD